ncbi:MAG: ATP-dependent DNA helicase [Sporichthyaceae bacterium]
MPKPSLEELLDAAVGDIDGVARPGQLEMARAVAGAIATGDHLLVQAGTGTGKSLAYLVPALLHGRTVVIATATLALQAQLIRRDLPRLIEAATPVLGRRPRFAILKGRSNYVCQHRAGGRRVGDEGAVGNVMATLDDADTLFGAAEVEVPSSPLGREVLRAREWAATTDTGDRDDLLPGVGDRAWAQISVTSRECLGATRCPEGETCFAELARVTAGEADIVVTNHVLLAIDALENIPVLPEHKVVIVDEAHELVDRVSAVATAELTVAVIERAVRASARVGDERAVDILASIAEGLGATLATVEPGRLHPPPPLLAAELAAVADAARGVQVSISSSKEDEPDLALAKRIARTALEEITATATRLATPTEWDVAWLALEERRGRVLRVAPLTVAGLLRSALFDSRTVVLTSATLAVGGAFDSTARTVGLSPADAVHADVDPAGEVDAAQDEDSGDETDEVAAPTRWRGLDVGSPFDYRRQGILYVARHLPPPGRDGMSAAVLDELEALIEAAGGGTLGLFSSRRAAEQAAAEMRPRLGVQILAQGDKPLNELVEAFRADTTSCLFGTLSLWQGVDVPGDACRLVVVDRIPFPRPDDPLSAARSAAADAAGGNGFMSVSAAQAAVKLAQGAGRLIRSDYDRGMVAVLDARLATARYSSFLRATLPPLWFTTDREVALGALRRLNPAAKVD